MSGKRSIHDEIFDLEIKEGIKRTMTKNILEMLMDGKLDKDAVILACLKYMNEGEVADMVRNDSGYVFDPVKHLTVFSPKAMFVPPRTVRRWDNLLTGDNQTED